MQHPDEGALHAFIDGELPEAEAARLELHIAECAHCAAALAEARGFVAAASRTISALDAAPSSARVSGSPVVVATPLAPRHTVRPPIFRASYARAAAVLLLVGGTAVVVDHSDTLDRGGDSRTEASFADAPLESARATSAIPEVVSSSAPATVPQAVAGVSRPTETVGGRSGSVGANAAPAPGVARDAATEVAARARQPARTLAGTSPAPLATGQGVASAASQKRTALPESASASAVLAAPPPARPAEIGAASALSPGARVSRFRTANGTILTLTEEWLRTAFAEERSVARRSTAQSPQRPADAAMSRPTVNSYSWVNAEQGRSYTLTGPLTVAELESLARRLIELERLP